ncbi:CAF17-like 4Fe-4S cluster assembly/insertion protein YgfZ [Jiella pacifica]|uniref:Folate-binding protein n=1 Tax=Jiella pacifica TaxID=2696469 RepID=A0A6N9T034_9HYPH|nr:folate-binding protein YgfZ [Jiella pacifica]NDW04723.1 folate-binding protein [Jiella pacifica]
MPFTPLPDRAVLTLTGPETEDFLQGLVTADVGAVTSEAVSPAALLTPQGKVMFEFLVSRLDGGLRLDVPAEMRAHLKKRLTLYRLRRKVEIAESDAAVFAVWGEDAQARGLVDRRFPDADVFRAYGEAPSGVAEAEQQEFRALRIASGVAELGADYPPSDVFPHDVLMDFNGGVSFKKGCFVGQEVVSRMQHRGTARRRLMLVTAATPLIANSEIRAGEKVVGEILSVADEQGLAMVRIDRLASAAARDAALTVEGVPVALSIPAFAGYVIPEAGIPQDGGGDADKAGDAA